MAGDEEEHKAHARHLVMMADMVTSCSEKTQKKAELQQFDESGADFLDPMNGDLSMTKTASQILNGYIDEDKTDDAEVKSAEGDAGGEDKDDGDGDGDRDGSSASPAKKSSSSSKKSSSSGSRLESKKDMGKSDTAAAAVDSDYSHTVLDSPSSPESDATLKEQLTQTRRALLQVRENAKLKYRKLEIEHISAKKELKKAKEVIEKQTLEYKKLRLKLDGVTEELGDAKDELARELGGRGNLVSGISQENGRMIRRIRQIRSERDALKQELDDHVRRLELCKCEAGKGYEATLTSSLAHETAPITSAALSRRSFGLDDELAPVTTSALSPRAFVSESRRNIFESARSIRSNFSDEMDNEIEAAKAEVEKMRARRRSSNESHVSFKNEGGRSLDYEEKEQHDNVDPSFISMSVRSLPAVFSSTKHALDAAWSTTSMRLYEEADPEHKRPDVDFPKGGRRRRGRRSYELAEDAETNLAPRAGGQSENNNSGSSFWSATSQRFLMSMADEVSTQN